MKLKTKMIKSLTFLFFISIFFFACEKTENAINPETINEWEIYNKSNGLGDNFVWSMVEDSEGNIWVGTVNNGVSKYDGEKWTVYNTSNGLIDNSVISIAEDKDGDMWFGTLGGISVMTSDEWIDIANIGGYEFTPWALLSDSRGDMYVGTSYLGLLLYKNNEWFQIFDSECGECNNINCIFEDNDNNIWFGSDGDLKEYDNQNINKYTTSNGLPEGEIKAIHQDNWGNLWVGSSGGEFVAKYKNGKFSPVSLFNGMPIYALSSIVSDRIGNVWFGLIGDGAVEYNGSVMKSYFEKDGLPDNTILTMLKDSKGYLWFGTSEGGVAKYISIEN